LNVNKIWNFLIIFVPNLNIRPSLWLLKLGILYDGQIKSLTSEPLSPYLYNNKIEKLFSGISSACYRGYCATWKIENKNIYLLNVESPNSIKGENADGVDEPITVMNKLFPGQTDVFAHWVNG